jgi:holin-like protein
MVRYLAQFITITLIYTLGNKIAALLHIPIPGSMIGMGILFLGLYNGGIKLSWVEDIAKMHIKHLSLLFIPFTVGVVHYKGIFQMEGIKLVITLVLSSLTVFLVTAYIAEALDKNKRGNKNGYLDL